MLFYPRADNQRFLFIICHERHEEESSKFPVAARHPEEKLPEEGEHLSLLGALSYL
jgi:ribosomal 50S subunit-associated protein YjgA (DUF615 family)